MRPDKNNADTVEILLAKALSLDKGGKDNVTVALARYRFPQ